MLKLIRVTRLGRIITKMNVKEDTKLVIINHLFIFYIDYEAWEAYILNCFVLACLRMHLVDHSEAKSIMGASS
jgi:hypothetical protein